MSVPIIKAENISKSYRLGEYGAKTLREDVARLFSGRRHARSERFCALSDISFEIERGERVGIIGANGAGKSTLLKILSQITAPDTGEIYSDGKVSSILEIGTGFHAELTGRENIYLNGAILGMSKSEIDKKIENIIDFSQCREFIDTPIKRYSSGMYVKLAFSVAAHLDSDILIMDEVLAVGDAAFQRKCIEKMRSVSDEEGRTILYVSHNMDTIKSLCSRCIVLDGGIIVFDGDTDRAIEIYLKNNREEKTYMKFTFSDVAKSLKAKERKIRLSECSYPSKKNTVEEGEALKVRIAWENMCDIPSLCFRLTVYDTLLRSVATSVVCNFCDAKKGTCEKEFSFDISMLADGEYLTRYTFFTNDAIKEDVESAMGLSFVKSAAQKDVRWRKVWGSVMLKSPEIEDIK